MYRTSRAASVRAQVYETLRSAIVQTALLPGQRLSEAEIASDLGVSRTPVRESLIQLADDRLVDVFPQIGTFVSRISVPNVREAQFVRAALECATLPLAIQQSTPGDVKRLRSVLEDQRAAQRERDLDRFQEFDDAFHRALMDRSGYTGVWTIAQRAKAHLDRARRLSLPEPHVIGELIDQHERILHAVAVRNVDCAQKELRDHLRMVLRLLGPLQHKYGDYFSDPQDGASANGDPVSATARDPRPPGGEVQ